MAKRGGKPLGNKRQHEQAKARKKRDKEARRARSKEAGLGAGSEQTEGVDAVDRTEPDSAAEGRSADSPGAADPPTEEPKPENERDGGSFPA